MRSGLLLFAIVALSAGCVNKGPGGKESKWIRMDGSSTVYPVSEAVAEDYRRLDAHTIVTVGLSGTGGGFKKFCRGEADICDASRPITAAEDAACRADSMEYIELPIAFDGIAIVVNKENNWLDKISVSELKKMWQPDAQDKLINWSDIEPNWPKEELHLFGTGTASGTFDYFTEAINGKAKAIRGDYTASANPNVLVEGIAKDRYALGFFGLAYYNSNKENLRLVPVGMNDSTAVSPSENSIRNGRYQPLSRPLFIYVSAKAAGRENVKAFVDFYLNNAAKLTEEVGYVSLPGKIYDLVKKRWANQVKGSVFSGRKTAGVQLEDLLIPSAAPN